MRQKLFFLAALPATFILGIGAQIVWLSSPLTGRYKPELLQGTVSADYDLTGVYYGAHEFPLAFDNVRRIDLATADFRVNPDSSVTRTPTAPWGYLVTDLDVYKLSSLDLSGGRLSFTTETHLGISYQFTGRVLAEGDYPIKGYSQYYVGKTIMVEGQIVRMLFGFKVAESEVRFTKGVGGC
jgi:hypothetical protein